MVMAAGTAVGRVAAGKVAGLAMDWEAEMVAAGLGEGCRDQRWLPRTGKLLCPCWPWPGVLLCSQESHPAHLGGGIGGSADGPGGDGGGAGGGDGCEFRAGTIAIVCCKELSMVPAGCISRVLPTTGIAKNLPTGLEVDWVAARVAGGKMDQASG